MIDQTNAKQTILAQAETILEEGRKRIYQALSEDQNLGITAFSQGMANEFSAEYSLVYALIGAYIEVNPDLIVAKGKGNGIMLKSKFEAQERQKEEKRMQTTFSKLTATVRELGFDKTKFEAAKRSLATENPTLQALKDWLEKQGLPGG